MSCEELHAILHLVLQAGNIMNAVRAHIMFICINTSLLPLHTQEVCFQSSDLTIFQIK